MVFRDLVMTVEEVDSEVIVDMVTKENITEGSDSSRGREWPLSMKIWDAVEVLRRDEGLGIHLSSLLGFFVERSV
jgi:hypothetical protein